MLFKIMISQYLLNPKVIAFDGLVKEKKIAYSFLLSFSSNSIALYSQTIISSSFLICFILNALEFILWEILLGGVIDYI